MEFSGQMVSIHALLPEIAADETRVVTVMDDRLGIKPGQYIFHELYCTDVDCDCRRAMIRVTDPDDNLYATLSYGWEDRQFYVDWMYGDTVGISDLPGINLYSLQQQSAYADKFLELFRDMMKDQTLAERYQRHYFQFKLALRDKCSEKSDATDGDTPKPEIPVIDFAQRKKDRRKLRKAASRQR